jgi:hypothetical protein
VVVTDDVDWAAAFEVALSSRAFECIRVAQPATRMTDAADQFAAAVQDSGPIDAVVTALGAPGHQRVEASAPAWQQLLDEHSGITDQILADAAWARAVADYSASVTRPVRLATLIDATTAGGRSRAQAAAQLARAAHSATANRVDAFAVAVEDSAARPHAAELAAQLLSDPRADQLSGAELLVAERWLGVRSHPRPAGTISFGGPSLPEWLDDAVQQLVGDST